MSRHEAAEPDSETCTNGPSRAARWQSGRHVEGREALIERDPDDVNPSRKPANWDGFVGALEPANIPPAFLSENERHQGAHDRDPFAGWRDVEITDYH